MIATKLKLNIIGHNNMLYNYIFFFNDTATTEIYTLSLHDALPIFIRSFDLWRSVGSHQFHAQDIIRRGAQSFEIGDRKSTRLNSSHSQISYAVFCLKKKIRIQEELATGIHRLLIHGKMSRELGPE